MEGLNLWEMKFNSNSQQAPQPFNSYTERFTYPTRIFVQTHIKRVSLEYAVEARTCTHTHTHSPRAGLMRPGDPEHPKDRNTAEPKQNQPAH